MSGRAYHDEGARRAAKFIEEEYKKLKLSSFSDRNDFFQEFMLDVNRIESSFLSVDNRTLSLGKDYIVASQSRSALGELPVVFVSQEMLTVPKKTEKFLAQSFRNKVAVFDSRTYLMLKNLPAEHFQKVRQAAAFIELVDGVLVASMSQNQSMNPYFLVKKDMFSRKAKRVKFDVKAKFERDYPTQNVVGFHKGQSDSIIVVGAHYDHVGELGNGIWIKGANDNASGTALMLDLANELTKGEKKYSYLFVAFGAEEVGLIGSQYFVNNPLVDLVKIKLMVNLDLLGAGSKGLTVVNAFENENYYSVMDRVNTENNYLPELKKRKNAANSDHFPFSEKNVPSIFVYTLGEVGGYHDIHDNPEDLEYESYNNVYLLMRDFLKAL